MNNAKRSSLLSLFLSSFCFFFLLLGLFFLDQSYMALSAVVPVLVVGHENSLSFASGVFAEPLDSLNSSVLVQGVVRKCVQFFALVSVFVFFGGGISLSLLLSLSSQNLEQALQVGVFERVVQNSIVIENSHSVGELDFGFNFE